MLKRMPNCSESLRQDQPEQVDRAVGTGAMGPGGVSRRSSTGGIVDLWGDDGSLDVVKHTIAPVQSANCITCWIGSGDGGGRSVWRVKEAGYSTTKLKGDVCRRRLRLLVSGPGCHGACGCLEWKVRRRAGSKCNDARKWHRQEDVTSPSGHVHGVVGKWKGMIHMAVSRRYTAGALFESLLPFKCRQHSWEAPAVLHLTTAYLCLPDCQVPDKVQIIVLILIQIAPG